MSPAPAPPILLFTTGTGYNRLLCQHTVYTHRRWPISAAMPYPKISIAAILSITILILSTPLASSAETSEKHWTLAELIDHAEYHNSDIEGWQWKVESADARRRKVNSAKILPRLRVNSKSGIVPEARGDVFNLSSDTLGIGPLGPFNRTDFEFVQPLYPISQGRNLNEAATHGVDVERADLAQIRLDVAYEIKEFYYGLLLAQDLNDLARRLSDELAERKKELADKDGISLSNRYKLELALLELNKQQREINDKEDLARIALAWRAGFTNTTSLVLVDQWLDPVTASVPPLEELSTRALGLRPDWRKLQAGLAAKQALTRAARAAYKPQVFVGGGLRYAIAPGRTDQRNPFVKDDFNYFNGGVFIGIQQNLEWHLLATDVDKARAEYRELKAREDGAVAAIRLDVRRAYLNYRRTAADLDDARRARKLARQWLQEARSEYEFDPDAIGDLIAAFKAWADLEQAHSEAIYDFNLSIAHLEKITGGLDLSLDDAVSP